MIKQRLLNLIAMTICFVLVISFLGFGQNNVAAQGKEIILQNLMKTIREPLKL